MLVVTFHNTHSALKADKVARSAGLSHKMIPVPRRLSADCGIALRTEVANRDRLEELLETETVPYQGLFEIEENG